MRKKGKKALEMIKRTGKKNERKRKKGKHDILNNGVKMLKNGERRSERKLCVITLMSKNEIKSDGITSMMKKNFKKRITKENTEKHENLDDDGNDDKENSSKYGKSSEG